MRPIVAIIAALALSASAQTNMGPLRTPQVNQTLYVGQSGYATIQSAVTYACKTTNHSFTVIIESGMTPSDTISAVHGGCPNTFIVDERALPYSSYAWNGSQYGQVAGGGGGSGGGASLPSNAIVYGLSATTSRAAGLADVIAYWGDPSCATSSGTAPPSGLTATLTTEGKGRNAPGKSSAPYMRTDGTCGTPSGTGSGGLTSNPFGMWGAMNANTNPSGPNGLTNILNTPLYQAQLSKSIFIDPLYYDDNSLDALNTSNTLRQGVLDMRYGSLRFDSYNPSDYRGWGTAGVGFQCLNGTAASSPYDTSYTSKSNTCLSISSTSVVPGYSFGAIAPAQPSGWYGTTTMDLYSQFYSAGINKSLISAQSFSYGKGDNNFLDMNSTNLYGGQDESAGEGNHVWRLINTIGGNNFSGSVYYNSVDHPDKGYVQTYINTSTTNNTLGVGRILLNADTAITDTATAQSINSTYFATQLTMTKSYTPSTVATLQSSITPNASAEGQRTAVTFNVSTGTALTVGQNFQIVGNSSVQNSPECGQVQATGGAPSGGVQSITAMLSNFHAGGSTIYIGGMACHYIVNDNDVMGRTNGTAPTNYVLASLDAHTLLVARMVGASWDPYIGSGVGPVHVYEGGIVLDVRCDVSVVPCQGRIDETVKVQETGAHFNGNILSSMIGTSRNDTNYQALIDNNPMSQGATNWYLMQGAQAGGYAGRDLTLVQNQMSDSDYVWGGGPFDIGWVGHWKGPTGGGFYFENALHHPFFQNFQCGFQFMVAYSNELDDMCSATITGPYASQAVNFGVHLQGDIVITSPNNPSDYTAILGDQGIQLGHPVSITNSYFSPPAGAAMLYAQQPYDAGAGRYVSGTWATKFEGRTMVESLTARQFRIQMPDFFPGGDPDIPNYGTVESWEMSNIHGTNLGESDTINVSYAAGTSGQAGFSWYSVQPGAAGSTYTSYPVMRLDSLGNLTVTSLNCTGTPCGSGGSGGGGGPITTTGLTVNGTSTFNGVSTVNSSFPVDGSDHPAFTFSNSGTTMINVLPSGGTVAGGGSKINIGDGTHPGFVDFNSFASMGYDPASSSFIWTTNNSGAGGFFERLRIKNNGNVGVANSNPSYLFSVSGNFGINADGSLIGPSTAPTGSCPTNGAWMFTQDGHATACISGNWTTKI